MRIFSCISLFAIPISALQIPSIFASFYEPYLRDDSLLISNETSIESHDLLKRDANCPVNYDSCTTLAADDGGACCVAGSTCTRDAAGNIACCPIGATCTGQLTQATGTTSGGGGVFGASATTTASQAAAVTTTSGTASVVSNAYFPFPYIPTTYVNSVACNSAYSACQANFAACTNDLAGNGFGVTVVAPNGGGVTVAPTVAAVGSASAASICSSLSQQACYGIQSSNCPPFGSGTTTGGVFVVATNTGAAPRQTVMAGMMVGVGLGIAGQMI